MGKNSKKSVKKKSDFSLNTVKIKLNEIFNNF